MINHIHILFLVILSQSLALANFVVGGHSRIYTFTGQDINKTGLYISLSTLQQFIFSDDHESLYKQTLNKDQDTSKINSSMVLFGRSFLKNHYKQHGKKEVINQEKRTQWISETIDSLVHINDSHFPILVMNEVTHENFYQASYRLISKGRINFDDGSYIKLMSTSAHAISEIGDITLSINEHGNVYINQGHICGRIIHFNTRQKALGLTSAKFLNNFRSDTDDENWILYKISDEYQKK